MSAPPYMKLYVADYLGDTHHLGAMEHGAYLLLLMAMWRAGGTLPALDQNLAKLARCTPDQWAEIRGSILPMFKHSRGKITHKRIAAELAKYENTSGKRSEAGKQGGRQKANNNKGNIEAFAKQTESNSRHNQNHNHIDTVSNETGAKPPSVDPIDPLADIRGLPIAKGSWRLALKLLMDRGGYPESRARPLVGKWAKALNGDHDLLWAVSEQAWATGTLDPVSYVTAAIERGDIAAKADPLLNPSETRQRLWMQDFKAMPSQWREHERGPPPGKPGCRVSPEIQREFQPHEAAA